MSSVLLMADQFRAGRCPYLGSAAFFYLRETALKHFELYRSYQVAK